MSDERAAARVRQVLALVAGHLERFADGDALALDALGAALQDPGLTVEDLMAAVWVLRALARGDGQGMAAAPGAAPGPQAQRVPSAEEREMVGPEAWGYLLALRGRGALDAGQFERVLDRLAGSGTHPASLAMAGEAAASVVLQVDADRPQWIRHEDLDVAH